MRGMAWVTVVALTAAIVSSPVCAQDTPADEEVTYKSLEAAYKDGLTANDTNKRIDAVRMMGRLEGDADRLVPFLAEAVSADPVSSVRAVAIDALGNRGEDAAHAALLVMTTRGALPNLRPRIVSSLMANPKAGDIEALAEVLLDARKPKQALQTEALQAGSDGERMLRRVLAAEIVGRIGGDRAVELLVGVSKDKAWQVRLAAARGLGCSCDERVLPELERLVKDDDPDVAVEAKAALEIAGKTVAMRRGRAAGLPPGKSPAPVTPEEVTCDTRWTDVVFVVDSAFKMASELEVVKSRIRDLMSSYIVQLKGNVSFAITAFHDPGGEFPSAAGILTSKRQAVDDFIFSMKPSGSSRDGASMDRILGAMAYRLNWHRNSRKIVFVFGDSLPDKPEDVQNLTRNLAGGENCELNMFHVGDKKKLSEAYDMIARLGKGECKQLDAAVKRR